MNNGSSKVFFFPYAKMSCAVYFIISNIWISAYLCALAYIHFHLFRQRLRKVDRLGPWCWCRVPRQHANVGPSNLHASMNTEATIGSRFLWNQNNKNVDWLWFVDVCCTMSMLKSFDGLEGLSTLGPSCVQPRETTEQLVPIQSITLCHIGLKWNLLSLMFKLSKGGTAGINEECQFVTKSSSLMPSEECSVPDRLWKTIIARRHLCVQPLPSSACNLRAHVWVQSARH